MVSLKALKMDLLLEFLLILVHLDKPTQVLYMLNLNFCVVFVCFYIENRSSFDKFLEQKIKKNHLSTWTVLIVPMVNI